MLNKLSFLSKKFRLGIQELGLESIDSTHPIIPVLYRNPDHVKQVVDHLFNHHVLAIGLTYPVVPKGSELIRFQMNTGLTDSDIEFVLESIKKI